MTRRDPIQGELQEQIMRTMWTIGRGSVEDVRAKLPKRKRGAYTTVQTVLNRLADRGLLTRARNGKTIVYSPKVSEADYLTGSLGRALAGASEDARRAALADLVGGLAPDELEEIRELAAELSRRPSG